MSATPIQADFELGGSGWHGHVRRGITTYRLGRERVGVILLEVIKVRLCVGVHSEGMCEGLEAQARSRKGLRKLVRGPSRRLERARKKELRECMNGRRLLVGYIKPQGVKACPAARWEGLCDEKVLW